MKKLIGLCFVFPLLFGFQSVSAHTEKQITKEQAKEIALEKVSGTVVSEHEEEAEGMKTFEFIIQKEDQRFVVDVDESSGKVISVQKEK